MEVGQLDCISTCVGRRLDVDVERCHLEIKKQGVLFIDTWNDDQKSVLFYTYYLLSKSCSDSFTG